MYGCESWTVKKAERQRLMLLNCGVEEDSWESLGLQGDPTNPFWRRSVLGFLGRNDAEAETPVLWPPHAKSWLIGKDCDGGRDWGQEEKGTTEDEMAGWHHWLDGCESEWIPGVSDGQGGLACCNFWGRRVGHDWATELNWTNSTILYLTDLTAKYNKVKSYLKTDLFRHLIFQDCIPSIISRQNGIIKIKTEHDNISAVKKGLRVKENELREL